MKLQEKAGWRPTFQSAIALVTPEQENRNMEQEYLTKKQLHYLRSGTPIVVSETLPHGAIKTFTATLEWRNDAPYALSGETLFWLDNVGVKVSLRDVPDNPPPKASFAKYRDALRRLARKYRDERAYGESMQRSLCKKIEEYKLSLDHRNELFLQLEAALTSCDTLNAFAISKEACEPCDVCGNIIVRWLGCWKCLVAKQVLPQPKDNKDFPCFGTPMCQRQHCTGEAFEICVQAWRDNPRCLGQFENEYLNEYSRCIGCNHSIACRKFATMDTPWCHYTLSRIYNGQDPCTGKGHC